MKKHTALLIALLLIAGACSDAAPAPETDPAGSGAVGGKGDFFNNDVAPGDETSLLSFKESVIHCIDLRERGFEWSEDQSDAGLMDIQRDFIDCVLQLTEDQAEALDGWAQDHAFEPDHSALDAIIEFQSAHYHLCMFAMSASPIAADYDTLLVLETNCEADMALHLATLMGSFAEFDGDRFERSVEDHRHGYTSCYETYDAVMDEAMSNADMSNALYVLDECLVEGTQDRLMSVVEGVMENGYGVSLHDGQLLDQLEEVLALAHERSTQLCAYLGHAGADRGPFEIGMFSGECLALTSIERDAMIAQAGH